MSRAQMNWEDPKTDWSSGSDITMRIVPTTASQKAPPKKEISLTTIILAGVIIWLAIFGALFGWAAFRPCSFLKFILGPGGIQAFQDRGVDVQDPDICRTILRGNQAA